MTEPKITITVGIDVGSDTAKVVLGSNHDMACDIVRNDVGGHTTRTAITFGAKGLRQIGDTANVSSKTKNTLLYLNRLLSTNTGGEDPFAEFFMFDLKKEEGMQTVSVDYNDQPTNFTAPAVMAMLLGKLKACVHATIARKGLAVDSYDLDAWLVLPPNSTQLAQEQWSDAAFAAGWTDLHLVEAPACYAATYHRKFPAGEDAEGDRNVLLVDMGHMQTTVSVLQFAAAAPKENGDEGLKEEEKPYCVLSSQCDGSVGAASVDVQLWHHFQSTLPKLKDIAPTSKSGQRLLDGCHKLKHLLSQLPQGSVTVENVNDADVQLSATRTQLVEICQAQAAALTELVTKVLADVEQLHAVEIVGGGCRIPWVQETLQQAVTSKLAQVVLAKSFDDTSGAMGAALLGEVPNAQEQWALPTTSDTSRCQQLAQAEQEMAAHDLKLHERAELGNRLEGLVLELRSAKDGPHGKLMPGDLDSYLNQVEDWLFSEEADAATLEDMKVKWDEVQEKTKVMCQEYYAAVQQQSQATEEALEREAKQAQAEAAEAGEDGDEDHDNRRLPKKRRMEIVMKNKAEANELFADGNFRFAAARYTKALSHCAKFVDLSPEDVQEINAVKLSLNLNLALAYTKLESPDQALRVCNDAIALDDTSIKAFYRRASIYYDKKNWDAAKQDVKMAQKFMADAGTTDKAIAKLAERVELQLKKQKQKEKKIAQKMFS